MFSDDVVGASEKYEIFYRKVVYDVDIFIQIPDGGIKFPLESLDYRRGRS